MAREVCWKFLEKFSFVLIFSNGKPVSLVNEMKESSTLRYLATSSHPTTTRGNQLEDDRAELWKEPGSWMILLVTGAAKPKAYPTFELPSV